MITDVWYMRVRQFAADAAGKKPTDICFAASNDGEAPFLCTAGWINPPGDLNGERIIHKINLPEDPGLAFIGYLGVHSVDDKRWLSAFTVTTARMSPLTMGVANALAAVAKNGPTRDVFLAVPPNIRVSSFIMFDGKTRDLTTDAQISDLRIAGDYFIGVNRKSGALLMAHASYWVSRSHWAEIKCTSPLEVRDLTSAHIGRPVVNPDGTIVLPLIVGEDIIVGVLDPTTKTFTASSIRTMSANYGVPIGWVGDSGHFGSLEGATYIIEPPGHAPEGYPPARAR